MERTAVTILLISSLSASASGAEWGDLRLRFTYDGEPPAIRELDADKDQVVCKEKLFDESLLVDKESRGIANVVVMLVPPNAGDVPIHESYAKTAAEPATIVARKCRFEPHVRVVRSPQVLILDNQDPIGHNPKLELLRNPLTSALIPAGGPIRIMLSKEEPDPVRLDCSIHAWMSAFVIVRANPYAGVSDKEGRVTLKKVPTGEWTFRIWHERARNVQEAQQGDQTMKWAKGRMQFTVKPGENDAGDFRLPAKLFNRR
jgi:hypothetical protein